MIVTPFQSCKEISWKEAGAVFFHSSEPNSENEIKLNSDQLVSWVRDPEHGFLKSKSIGDIKYLALYKPLDYIICLEEKSKTISDSIYKLKLKELEGFEYFDLRIQFNEDGGELLKKDIQTNEEYQNRLNYCAFLMQKDISLETDSETIPCTLFHFERAFDVSPQARFLLGFQKTNTKSGAYKTLIFEDKLLNNGIIKFSFKNSELLSSPKLNSL